MPIEVTCGENGYTKTDIVFTFLALKQKGTKNFVCLSFVT
jgi:hypothetical protein